MPSRRESTGWRLAWFLAWASLVHAHLLAFLIQLGIMFPRPPATESEDPIPQAALGQEASDEPIDVTMIEPQALNPFAEVPDSKLAVQELEEKVAKAKKEEAEVDPNRQVVDVAKPVVEIRPEEAKYSAEYDSKVERETKAARRSDTPSHHSEADPTLATPAEAVNSKPGALAMRSQTGTGSGSRVNPLSTPGGNPEGLAQENLPPADPSGMLVREGEGGGDAPAEPAPDQGGGDGNPLPSRGDLKPSSETLARAVGSGSIDYLKDVDEGAQTLLNTKRWKYATFFNRVKRSVEKSWRPDVAYRLRDPSGQIYGHKNRLTVLRVSLEPSGAVRDILVEKPCGVDFLDDEAVTAFRDAQPFPNPPQGLVDEGSHLITFRFAFFFEISDSGRFKVFRYSN